MSESQERMMAVVAPDRLDAFLAVTAKWDVETSVLGEVTGTGRLEIRWRGETIVDVDPTTVAVDGPVYDRPVARPAWLDAVQADSAAALPRDGELRAELLAVLGSPSLADAGWITDQYDRYVLGNTALSYPDDGGMIRVDESTGLGVALATDANGRFGRLDPRAAAALALSEAYRNVAMTGATPLAVTDCLNLGAPTNPEVMWQLAETVEGLAGACLALEVPVTGGNVSLYNQTGDVAIHPTPVVGVLGVIDDVARRVPSGWQDDGLNLYLLGRTALELDGSAWAGVVHGHLGGRPPEVRLDAERALAGLVAAAAKEGLLLAAHDLSGGGFAQSLAEGVLRFGVGARVWLDGIRDRDGVDAATALFSESSARAIVAVPREEDVRFQALCAGRRVPVMRVGVTDAASGMLEIQDVCEIPVAELRAVHRATLPAALGPTVA